MLQYEKITYGENFGTKLSEWKITKLFDTFIADYSILTLFGILNNQYTFYMLTKRLQVNFFPKLNPLC